MAAMEAETFVYVLIPSDASKAVSELRHRKNVTLEDDDLREELKQHFAREAISAEQTDELVASLRAQSSEAKVDEASLRRMAEVIGVDTYPLTVPTKESPHAVSLYTDAKSHAKRLPPNARAIELAAACGAQAQEYRGDVFLSRYFDDDDQWLREDLRLTDLSSDAAWIQAARDRPSRKSGANNLHDLYDQLGGSSGNKPMTIDSRAVEREAMDRVHDEGQYQWTQSKEDIEIRLHLDAAVKKADIRVALTRSSLSVSAKGATLLAIPRLFALVDADAGANWTLEGGGGGTKGGKTLVLTLDKFDTNAASWSDLAASSS